MPLNLPSGHDILVFRSYDLNGAFPRTAVRPDDPIQDRGHDNGRPDGPYQGSRMLQVSPTLNGSVLESGGD